MKRQSKRQRKAESQLLELVTEIKAKSARYRAFCDIRHKYLFDDYNNIDFEPVVTQVLDGRKKDAVAQLDALAVKGLSTREIVEKMKDDADVVSSYFWWRHYYTYYPDVYRELTDFMTSGIDAIPALAEPITIGKKIYDGDYVANMEFELLTLEFPKPMVEFAITVRHEVDLGKFHAKEYFDAILSGFTLSDAVERLHLIQPETLQNWRSPDDLILDKAYQEAWVENNRRNAEHEAFLENARQHLKHSYEKVITQFKDAALDAYGSLITDLPTLDSDLKVKNRLQSYNRKVDKKARKVVLDKIHDITKSIDVPELKSFGESSELIYLGEVQIILHKISSQTTLISIQGVDMARTKEELRKLLNESH